MKTPMMLSCGLVVLLLACGAPGTAALAAPKPNFVILFVDDMGINQIQLPDSQKTYGFTGNNGTVRTPNFYQVASEGLVFQTWYSGAHLCSPSRAAMMTGRLPIRVGIIPGVLTADAVGGLPLNETTIAKAVGAVGYKTMAIGKWHLGQRAQFLPTSHGFDHYFGIPYSQDMGLNYWFFCNGPPVNGKPPHCDPRPQGDFQPVPNPLLNDTTIVDQPAGLYTLNERYVKAASNFIQQSGTAGDPFLLYVPFNHIHAPNSCGKNFCGTSERGPIGDSIQEVDNGIGEIMAAIKDPANGVATNTLVFITSDNGAPMHPDGNLPLRGYKASIWEGGFREPGIVWWPGKVKAGSSSQALVATYDIFPTIISLSGAKMPEDRMIDGVDLADVIFADKPELASGGHDCIMFYRSPNSSLVPDSATRLDGLGAVRCGNYKVYWYIDKGSTTPLPRGYKVGDLSVEKPAIFDLSKDYSEDHPLDATTDEYKSANATAWQARVAHIATLTPVVDQLDLGSSYEYALCSDPNSTSKYPSFPKCTISPDNWEPPICLLGGNIQQCASQTSCQPGCKFVNCSSGF